MWNRILFLPSLLSLTWAGNLQANSGQPKHPHYQLYIDLNRESEGWDHQLWVPGDATAEIHGRVILDTHAVALGIDDMEVTLLVELDTGAGSNLDCSNVFTSGSFGVGGESLCEATDPSYSFGYAVEDANYVFSGSTSLFKFDVTVYPALHDTIYFNFETANSFLVIDNRRFGLDFTGFRKPESSLHTFQPSPTPTRPVTPTQTSTAIPTATIRNPDLVLSGWVDMLDLFYLAKDWNLEAEEGQDLKSDLDRDGRVAPQDAHYLLDAWHQAFP